VAPLISLIFNTAMTIRYDDAGYDVRSLVGNIGSAVTGHARTLSDLNRRFSDYISKCTRESAHCAWRSRSWISRDEIYTSVRWQTAAVCTDSRGLKQCTRSAYRR